MRAPRGFALHALAALLALGALACDRVPEQSLRDEQARSRQYRDAYESEHDENAALRTRLEQLEQRKCNATGAAEPARQDGLSTN